MKTNLQDVAKCDLDILYWQEIADEIEILVDRGDTPRKAVEVVAERRGCLIEGQSAEAD